jgi:hypothetical protein
MSTPMRRTRSPCCARAASGHAATAENRDELAAFQFVELHLIPCQPESALQDILPTDPRQLDILQSGRGRSFGRLP